MKNLISFFIVFSGCSSALVTHGQVPKLNSYLVAASTIYLDFDGQYITGTSWNWGGAINALPSGLSQEVILEIFNRVSEDYRPFNLNITTDSTVFLSAPFDKRMRLIITPTSEWYGRAGGISYVGSFNWGTETPSWVFSALLSNNAKYIAEACSHEAGHTLGLQHQSIYDENCVKITEYNDGKGDGEIGWAPIMGLGYYKNLTTWYTGPNTENCNTIQNDLSVIGGLVNNFGFRNDDHGNDPASATNIPINGLSFLVNGLINTPADTDAFRMILQTSTRLRLNAIPQNTGSGNAGANIDINISVLDARSINVGAYNPALLLGAAIDTNLNSGEYYILVNGTSNENNADFGSMGFYWLSANLEAALPVHQFILKASDADGFHRMDWTFVADEKIKNIVVEGSKDGIVFYDLVDLPADSRSFVYKPFSNNRFYRVKAITTLEERRYYSNIATITNPVPNKPFQLLSTIVQFQIICVTSTAQFYQIFDAGGRLLLKGKTVKGVNHIDIGSVSKGMIFFRIGDGVGGYTERLIKQ